MSHHPLIELVARAITAALDPSLDFDNPGMDADDVSDYREAAAAAVRALGLAVPAEHPQPKVVDGMVPEVAYRLALGRARAASFLRVQAEQEREMLREELTWRPWPHAEDQEGET